MSTSEVIRQYLEQKQDVGEAILLFRAGDFYEIVGKDAITCAKALGLTLSTHGNHALAGVPYHSIGSCVSKLRAIGHDVALRDYRFDPERKAVTV